MSQVTRKRLSVNKTPIAGGLFKQSALEIMIN